MVTACALLLVLAACSTGVNVNESSDPTPTIGTTSDTSVPTRLPVAATQTAQANQVPYTIERIVLSTDVADDGEPLNEVSVLSQEQQNIFLTVRIRGIPEGARFQAIWQEGDEVIGQSDVRVDEPSGSVQWVALPFRSVATLNPAETHTVELIINDRSVNTFAFRVGVGNASDIIAETTIATGIDESGNPVSPGEAFDRHADQIVLIARISNMVDPTGMIFTAQWSRGSVPLAQGTPDNGQPMLTGEPTDRIMTFTFSPQSSLVPGNHQVSIHLNGRSIADVPFQIMSDGAASDDEPEDTPPTPEPTATPVDPAAGVLDIVVATEIDEDTSEPEDEVQLADGFPAETLDFYVAVELEGLSVDDRVEITTGIGNSIINRYELPVAALEQGWMATVIEVRAPDIQDRTVTYEVTVYINGSRAGGTTFDVLSSQEAPPATPTPDPFNVDGDDEDDDDDD